MVGAGAGERVDRMVNGASVALGSIPGSGTSGLAGLWGRRLMSTMNWQRLGGLQKGTGGGLVEEVMG